MIPLAASAATLTIYDAKPNASLTRVVITGQNFGTGSPTIKLGSQALVLVPPVTATRIEATLPSGLAAGTYRLVVTNGKLQDSLAVAIAESTGAAGRWRVVDSLGNFFGYWVDGGFSMVGDTQGYAAREIAGKWVAMGFSRDQIFGGGGFFHTSADCSSPRLLPVDDYASGSLMSPNWTNAGTLAYSYPDTGTLQTIQSISAYNTDGSFNACNPLGSSSFDTVVGPPGGSIDLGTLTPPFTFGMP